MTKTENMDIEIRDKEVDVKKIMEKIRKNIQKRKKEQRVVEVEDLEKKTEIQNLPYNLRQDVDIINANWDTENKTYLIFSHRKILGPALIKGRELVHGEIKRYADPVFWKQKEFNSGTVRILNHFSKEVPEIKEQLTQQKINLTSLSKEVPEIKEQLTQQKINLTSLSKEVPEIKEQLDESLDINYYKFENKFRGSETDIKNRQRIYIRYFQSKKNVLDIGCGRGEFLELLKENVVKAKGIDINKKMVEHCKKKGLYVIFFDALDYLESIPDNSLEGIFMAQVIEHFKPRKIVEIINLSYKKLKKGSYFVIETVNPASFTSLSNFNLDLSHIKLLHPSLMEFLLQSAGFREIEVRFLSPIPEVSKLKKINIDKKLTDPEKKFLEVHNDNIEKLNSIIYGYQDYAIIGKK
jgi:O-antigen chain-terminating methyltransferase